MDHIQDDLTCQICQGYYKSPRALPCIHSFCEGCLRDYVFSRGFDATGHFPCPLCRADTHIPPSGVAAFPLNHLLQSLIHTLRQSGDLADSVDSSCEGLETRYGVPATDYNNRNDGNQSYPGTTAAGTNYPNHRDDVGSANRANPGPRSMTEHSRRPTSGRGSSPTAPPMSRPSSPPVLRVSNMSAFAQALDIPIKYSHHRAKVIFGKFGSGLAHFTQPMGLCFTNHYGDCLIHVTDQRSTRVMTFNCQGQIKTIFTTEGQLSSIASDGMNALYVAMANAPNREALVLSYDLHGTALRKFGNMFSFVTPDGVALSKYGDVIVTSVQEKQAYIFNKQGTLIQKFGKKGSGPDAFLTPYHVATNSYNEIIISDCDSHCLKVFDKNGKSKFAIGQKGNRIGQLFKPRGIAIDQNNNIIVADAGNHRIQIFNSKGKFQDFFITNLDKQGFPTGCSIYAHDLAVCPGSLAVLFKGRDFAEVRLYDYHSQESGGRPNPLSSSVCACQ